MKCKNCKKIRFKTMDLILKIKTKWQRVQVFGKQSGEHKGNFTFCNNKCREEFLTKHNYSLE